MPLPPVQLLLLADVLPHRCLVEATMLTQYPTAQKCRPNIRRSRSSSRWMRTALLPLRNPTVFATLYFGAPRQAQVDVVGHRVPLDQLDAALPARVAQDPAHVAAQVAVQGRAAVLWDEDDVILAVPPDVGLTFPFAHRVLLSAMRPGRGLPGRRTYAHPRPGSRR